MTIKEFKELINKYPDHIEIIFKDEHTRQEIGVIGTALYAIDNEAILDIEMSSSVVGKTE